MNEKTNKPKKNYTNVDNVPHVKVYSTIPEMRKSQFIRDWITRIGKIYNRSDLIAKKRVDKLDELKNKFITQFNKWKKHDYLEIALIAEYHSSLIISLERIKSNTKKKDGVLDTLAQSQAL